MSKGESTADKIKALLSEREGMASDADITPTAERCDREVQKIIRIVNDIDPRLRTSSRERTISEGITVELSVLQSGFENDPIVAFLVAKKLDDKGRMPPFSRLFWPSEEIIRNIQSSLAAKVEHRQIRE